MSVGTRLPNGFEYLAPFAATWGQLDNQEDRYLLRQASSMDDLRAFYDAAVPRLEEVFTHLEKFPMDALPPSEALLYNTILGLSEVGQAIEVFNQPTVPYAPRDHRVKVEWLEAQQ